jgi:hypothetical protein
MLVICPKCNGEKFVPVSDPNSCALYQCDKCRGEGHIDVVHYSSPSPTFVRAVEGLLKIAKWVLKENVIVGWEELGEAIAAVESAKAQLPAPVVTMGEIKDFILRLDSVFETTDEPKRVKKNSERFADFLREKGVIVEVEP